MIQARGSLPLSRCRRRSAGVPAVLSGFRVLAELTDPNSFTSVLS